MLQAIDAPSQEVWGLLQKGTSPIDSIQTLPVQLEGQPQTQLHLPRIQRTARLAKLRPVNAIVRSAAYCCQQEVGVIEQVEQVAPELQVEPLRDLERLADCGIEHYRAGTDKGITSQGASATNAGGAEVRSYIVAFIQTIGIGIE